MSFDESVRSSKCPYAGLAVWSQFDIESSIIEECGTDAIKDAGVAVRELIVSGMDQELDMLAVRLEHRSAISGLEAFTGAVSLFMHGLLGPEALPDRFDDPAEWTAYVEGKRLFVFALCPFYGDSHLRRSSPGEAFIVIQFIRSFRKINMHRMSLDDKKMLSDKVKAVFLNAGIDYFAPITQGRAESFKLVKPLSPGDAPVAWWAS
jgi:hypothetical protein